MKERTSWDGADRVLLGIMVLFLAPLEKIAAGLAIAYGAWKIYKSEQTMYKQDANYPGLYWITSMNGEKAVIDLRNVTKIATRAGPMNAPARPNILQNPKYSPDSSWGMRVA